MFKKSAVWINRVNFKRNSSIYLCLLSIKIFFVTVNRLWCVFIELNLPHLSDLDISFLVVFHMVLAQHNTIVIVCYYGNSIDCCFLKGYLSSLIFVLNDRKY